PRRAQHELAHELALAEVLGADDADLADLRDAALLDVEVDGDAVALERGHRRVHPHGVVALAEILALQLLLGAIELAAVEDAALGYADLAQAGEDLVLLERAHADRKSV